ncbi:hypothetical protein GQ600_26075 [Phytophthora cactorum]|nr:hypothetical protein GQ600_26075 [Phytophthora cactorum]
MTLASCTRSLFDRTMLLLLTSTLLFLASIVLVMRPAGDVPRSPGVMAWSEVMPTSRVVGSSAVTNDTR